MIVLDTNVLSEIMRPSPSPAVLQWIAAQEPLSVFTTTITQAEILHGVELLPPGKRRIAFHGAVESMLAEEFGSRILPFDEDAAHAFATIASRRHALGCPISQFDAMIAAIASSRQAAIATRNARDFRDCGIPVIDPFGMDE
jgi:predicted nucleic acid-binding protein